MYPLLALLASVAFAALLTETSQQPLQTTDAALHGTVWADVNGDGRRQADERGIRSVTVSAKNEATGKVSQVQTGLAGDYSFEGMAEGPYLVTVAVGPISPGFGTYPQREPSGLLSVAVALAGRIEGVDFGIYPTSLVPRVSGGVKLDGEPFIRADVVAVIDGTPCSVADPIRAPNAPSNFYSVAVFPEEYRGGCGAPGKSISFLVNGRPANETTLWRPPGPTLSINLDLSVGSPMSGSAGAVIRPPDTGSAGLVR